MKNLLKRLHEYFTLKEYTAYIKKEQLLTEQWESACTYSNEKEKHRLQALIAQNEEAYRNRYK